MPNYLYKGSECGDVNQLFLPISFDPKVSLNCYCSKTCLRYRIISPKASFKGFKVFAGDWFEKTYGHDIGQKAMERAQKVEEIKRDQERLIKEGHNININFNAEDD